LTSTEKQSELLLMCLPTLKKEIWHKYRQCPNTIAVPLNVLYHWRDQLQNEIPKLKQKIIELECRPPIEGGAIYRAAQAAFCKRTF
jgi:hypothetical protein